MSVSTKNYSELNRFTYPPRPLVGGPKRLYSNPIDELDTLNHYAFAGRRDMTRRFLVLTLNDHSSGDETIFLAVQLAGTDSIVYHHDSSAAALDFVRKRAEAYGVAGQIRFVAGSLEHFLDSLGSNPGFPTTKDSGPFDYVRCASGLGDREHFENDFNLLLRFLKPDGAIGMSCFGYYAREPYRQMQRIAEELNSDDPGFAEEIDRLKELFPFLPQNNWTRMAFDNLDPTIRSMKDDAFVEHFIRPDRHALKLPEIHELLDRTQLRLVQFSRQTRMLYEPWFAQSRPELARRIDSLPLRDRQAVSEIAWSLVEKHHFWAVRQTMPDMELDGTDNIPFFNPIVFTQKNWKKILVEAGPDVVPELLVLPNPVDRYSVSIPWGVIPHRFVGLIDGFKTLGELFMTLREEFDGKFGIERIVDEIMKFLSTVWREDIILLRHRTTPILPFTSRSLRAKEEPQ